MQKNKLQAVLICALLVCGRANAVSEILPRAPKQGVIAICNIDSVTYVTKEGAVDGGSETFIELPAGRQWVVARRKGYCDDGEFAYVYPGQVTSTKFLVRKWRLEMSQEFSLFHVTDLLHSAIASPISAGLSHDRHHYGLSFLWSWYKDIDYREIDQGYSQLTAIVDFTRFINLGLRYGYSLVRCGFADIQAGGSVGYWHTEKRRYVWSEVRDVEYYIEEYLVACGPDLKFAAGFENLKVTAGLGYGISLRRDFNPFDVDKNVWGASWGLAWRF